MAFLELQGSFLPGLIWLGFPQLGWHLAVLMALTLYVGNAMKDLVSAPRPLGVSDNNSHHIVLLEGETKEAGLNAKEYGLPSSHTMNSVCLNFYLCHYLHEQGILGEKETLITYSLAVVWCTWIAISRLYLGLHSPIDLLAGLIAGFTVLTTFISIENVLEAWIAMGPLFVGSSAALICLILLRLHPRPLHATPTYEFSTSIMGVMFGTTTAVSRFQEYHKNPIRINELGDVHYAWHIRRLMAGFAILMASKVVFKALSFALLPRLYLFFPLKLRRLWQPPVHNQCLPKNMENPALRALPHSPRGKPFDVEMTARFFAYAGIGLGAAELAPRVFTFVGW